MKYKRPIFTIFLAFCLLGSASAFEVESLNLHLYLVGITAAQPPAIVENHLVLSVQGVYRSVGASFSHENWVGVHGFEKNRNNVFVLALPLPFGSAKTVSYRMKLDGLWTTDPSNSRLYKDSQSGISVSLAEFPERPFTEHGIWNPGIGSTDGSVDDSVEGSALFFFRGDPGERVCVAGSFNGWDPFLHELTEVQPGRYELRLDLQAGTYNYVFIYKGERIQDPLNSIVLYGKDGRPVSSVTIASK